jgi:hypothetical protein
VSKTGRPLIDLTGRRFGRWTVVSFARTNGVHPRWNCACDCGTQREVDGSLLRRGNSTSCGCYRREMAAGLTLTHGHASHAAPSGTYKTWCAMLARCRRQNHIVYDRYGGRGISVCERWHSFENFLADMGERPEGMTLDRVDVDGNYEPENCRWATATEQNRNRSTNVINAVGVALIRHMRRRGVRVDDLAHAFGISQHHVYSIARAKIWNGS